MSTTFPLPRATRTAAQGIRAAGLVGTFILTLLASSAEATNGAQLGGYGIKNAGMGGASIALPLDASAAANNPAGMAYVPNSFVGNLVLFHGQTHADVFGTQLDDNTSVVAPEGGINLALTPVLTVGLTFSGAGAGADYGNPLPMGTITAKASQKVADLIPSIAWKPVPELALGLGIIFSTQEFSAQGLVAPSPAGPVTLSGHGTQTASGIGARVGVLWNPLPELGLGVTYKTRTSMGPLGGYANDILSYSGGAADVPAEYGAGIAWKISPAVIIAGDLILVKYGDLLINQDPLGVGWRDQPIVKLGLSWDIYSSWTLRTGMSSNRTQIYSSRTYQNILSPALSQTAYTLGASMRMDAKSDFSFSLELNPSQTIRGTDMSTGTNLEGKAQVMRLGYQRQF